VHVTHLNPPANKNKRKNPAREKKIITESPPGKIGGWNSPPPGHPRRNIFNNVAWLVIFPQCDYVLEHEHEG
jgi:hypothetical protein